MRLVDAHAISGSIERFGVRHPSGVTAGAIPVQEVIDLIDFAPTIDAAPVVHAHWVRQPQINHEERFRCSRCSQEVRHCEMNSRVYEYFRYCSSCGAKMDEEVDTDGTR